MAPPDQALLALTSTENEVFSTFASTHALLQLFTPTLTTSTAIPAEGLEACLSLIALTSSAAYKASSNGWSVRDKRKEMSEEGMRYILLRVPTSDMKAGEANKVSTGVIDEGDDWIDELEGSEADKAATGDAARIAGFLSYLPTTEHDPDSDPADFSALYIYEVHLRPSFQSRGLGRLLMALVEELAAGLKMRKTMLTVFASNEAGLRFYDRLGYEKWDEEVVVRTQRRLRGKTVQTRPSYVILAKDVKAGD